MFGNKKKQEPTKLEIEIAQGSLATSACLLDAVADKGDKYDIWHIMNTQAAICGSMVRGQIKQYKSDHFSYTLDQSNKGVYIKLINHQTENDQ